MKSNLEKYAFKSFTLLELLLSVTIIVILGAGTFSFSNKFFISNNIDIAANTVAQTARTAQGFARSSYFDSNFGIKIQAGSVVLFQGDSFAARDLNFDDNYSIASNITVNGIDEIIFAKFSGDTQNVGDIVLSVGTETKIMNINAKGNIEY